MQKPEIQLVTVKGSELKKIANSTSTSEVLFTYLAMRERLSTVTDLVRTRQHLMAEGEKIIDEEYYRAFDDLEKGGYGVLVRGRGNKNDRFHWNYSLKAIGKAAVEGKDEESPLITRHARKTRTAKTKSQYKMKMKSQQDAEQIQTVSNEFCITFKIPTTLTKMEAELIKSTVDRLVA